MKTLALLGAIWAVFPLRDAGGTLHPATELKDHPLVVLVFLSTECPLCNRAVPDLNALSQRHAGKVRFFAVNPERDRTAAQVLAHDREYALAFPTLLDPQQALAKAAGATVTPEAVVLDSSGAVLYRGRLDDRAADFGKVRARPRREDLRLAVEEALAGRPISVPETPVLGCYIQGATP
jgi:thiol-disulfide isomerase/thioredoxin